MLPILYTAELDLPDEDVDAFLRWFAFRHVPDLARAGFPVWACYRAIEGDMNLIDIYELPAFEVLTGPTYTGMGGRDGHAADILAKRRDKSNTVYAQRPITPETFGEPSLDADWVSIIRFEADPETAGTIERALEADAARLSDLGAQRIRFAERRQDHPVYSTHRPRWLAMAEWAAQPPETASLSALLAGIPAAALSNVKPFTGYRVYPWPDDRSLRA